MKKLDAEEREILDAYRKGKLERVILSAEEIERYRKGGERSHSEGRAGRAMTGSRSAHALLLTGVVLLPTATRGDELPAAETAQELQSERAFDWTVGDWTGVRRDGADGSEAPMTMRVAAILGGAGQVRELEVRHTGGVYRGFSVVAFEREASRWVEQYVNEVHGRFVRLEGELEDGGARSVWRTVAPERRRESRLVSERLAPDRWRRTQSVSEDGGATWRVLWIDELERKGDKAGG